MEINKDRKNLNLNFKSEGRDNMYMYVYKNIVENWGGCLCLYK